jgi:hypothetical protein
MDFHEKLGFALWRVGNHMVDETVEAADDEVGGRGGGAFLEGVVAGSTTGYAQPAKAEPLTEQERLHLGGSR